MSRTALSYCEAYSGIVINQNPPALASVPFNDAYQRTFTLPDDYSRGVSVSDPIGRLPSLTGFQVNVTIDPGAAASATLTWSLSVWDPVNLINVSLAQGTSTGCAQDGTTWFSVYFDVPVTVTPAMATASFTLAVQGTAGLSELSLATFAPLSSALSFGGSLSAPRLVLAPTPSTSPFATTPIGCSMLFRILADTADGGTDFLGNPYRSATITQPISNLTPGSEGYWLSKASPSRFAVESLYLDQRQNGGPVVIDAVTLDPLTPGVAFHLYYSQDPTGPGTDVASWEHLLWTPVYKTFVANRKQTFPLPGPIVASYVKVEFTMLQPRYYDPGFFQMPVFFKKHPKWVLQFFVSRFSNVPLDLLSSAVNITYDALDLAYQYYSGDILLSPDPPALAGDPATQQAQFVAQSPAEMVDATTLSQIPVNFQPYLAQPAQNADLSTLLGQQAASTIAPSYATEDIVTALGNTSIVSNSQREPLLVEKGIEAMFFYLTCRHAYRVSKATFGQNIGYFAGVNALTFHREVYGTPRDTVQYNEVMADGQNALINDWLSL